jgi:hypothetical protein
MTEKKLLFTKIHKRRLRIRDKKIKALLSNNTKNNTKEDFFELLKRAVHP